MKRGVEFKINNKKIMKKLEEIALKKYPPDSNQHDSQNIYMDGRNFIPVNNECPFGLPKNHYLITIEKSNVHIVKTQ